MKASLERIGDYDFYLILTPDEEDFSEKWIISDLLNVEATLVIKPMYGTRGPTTVFKITVVPK